MIHERTGREPDVRTTRDHTSLSIAILSLSIIILISGCIIAVYRDDRSTSKVELERSSESFIYTVEEIFSNEGGYFSLPLFLSRPDVPGDAPGRDGRDFKVKLTILDSGPIEISYGEGGEWSSKASDMVAVDMGDGSIRPGYLEVVLYGS